MITVRVVRRFRFRMNGGGLTERFRIMECPGIPPKGTLLDFGDGSGESVIAFLRLNLRPATPEPGFFPTAVVLHTESESAERLVAAEKAGWKPVTG